MPSRASFLRMLPILGVLGLNARDLSGFTFLQFAVNLPLVLVLLRLLGMTLNP